MGVERVVHLLCLLPLVSALLPPPGPHLIDDPPRHPLCEMGCKCPEEGQAFTILDCSRRGITSLPTSLQSNRLSHLGKGAFSEGEGVEQLDLSHNHIVHVDNSTFAPLNGLSLLRISYNHLDEIGPGLLEGLTNLRVLEVGHNAVQRLTKGAFRATPRLLELRMQYNPLFELPEDLFEYIPKLQRLDLQDTGLVILPNKLFAPTQSLQWLSLASNAFENVPEEALAQAPVLESLDLSGNDFTSFVQGDFIDLSKVSLLYLNNLSRLTRIEKDAFIGLQRLKTFSCSFNPKLVYVDEEAFGSRNSTMSRTIPYEQLYLRQNALSTMKSPLEMSSWSSLSFVDLGGNPWKCDCNLLWMRHLEKETQTNIVCESPAHLKGRSLITLGASELKCQDKWVLTTFILTMAVMGAVGLVVLAASAVVCSRTPAGLYVRAKRQFAYAKVQPKTETVDLEWDPSADI